MSLSTCLTLFTPVSNTWAISKSALVARPLCSGDSNCVPPPKKCGALAFKSVGRSKASGTSFQKSRALAFKRVGLREADPAVFNSHRYRYLHQSARVPTSAFCVIMCSFVLVKQANFNTHRYGCLHQIALVPSSAVPSAPLFVRLY